MEVLGPLSPGALEPTRPGHIGPWALGPWALRPCALPYGLALGAGAFHLAAPWPCYMGEGVILYHPHRRLFAVPAASPISGDCGDPLRCLGKQLQWLRRTPSKAVDEQQSEADPEIVHQMQPEVMLPGSQCKKLLDLFPRFPAT